MQEEVRQEIIEEIKDKKLVKSTEILLELLSKVNPHDEEDSKRKGELEELVKMVMENEDCITNENIVTIPKMVEYLDNGTKLNKGEIVTILDDLFTPQAIPHLLDCMNDMVNKGYIVFEIEVDKEYFGLRYDVQNKYYSVYILKLVDGKEVCQEYPALSFKHGLLAVFISSNLIHYLVMNLGSIDAVVNNKYIEKLLDTALVEIK